MMHSRRTFLTGTAAAGLASALCLPPAAQAQNWPARGVVFISPFVAGGPNDLLGRVVAEPLREALKQSVNVENVTGAGGLVATNRILAAPRDGYQVLIGAAYLVTAPHLYKTATFDPAKDFIPLSPPVESSLVFVASQQSPDLKTLIENAKRSGKPIRVASPGAGTLSHLGAEMLRLASGAPTVHAAYRGVAPALSDIMGGHADLMLDAMSSSLPLVRDGRLKALAVPDEQRNPLLPDVPTTGQVGYPTVKVRAWNAFFATAGTPQPVVDLLRTEITKIVTRADVTAELKKRGLEPTPISAIAFRERIAAESEHWKSLVRTAKITAE